MRTQDKPNSQSQLDFRMRSTVTLVEKPPPDLRDNNIWTGRSPQLKNCLPAVCFSRSHAPLPHLQSRYHIHYASKFSFKNVPALTCWSLKPDLRSTWWDTRFQRTSLSNLGPHSSRISFGCPYWKEITLSPSNLGADMQKYHRPCHQIYSGCGFRLKLTALHEIHPNLELWCPRQQTPLAPSVE